MRDPGGSHMVLPRSLYISPSDSWFESQQSIVVGGLLLNYSRLFLITSHYEVGQV